MRLDGCVCVCMCKTDKPIKWFEDEPGRTDGPRRLSLFTFKHFRLCTSTMLAFFYFHFYHGNLMITSIILALIKITILFNLFPMATFIRRETSYAYNVYDYVMHNYFTSCIILKRLCTINVHPTFTP